MTTIGFDPDQGDDNWTQRTIYSPKCQLSTGAIAQRIENRVAPCRLLLGQLMKHVRIWPKSSSFGDNIAKCFCTGRKQSYPGDSSSLEWGSASAATESEQSEGPAMIISPVFFHQPTERY